MKFTYPMSYTNASTYTIDTSTKIQIYEQCETNLIDSDTLREDLSNCNIRSEIGINPGIDRISI